MQAPCYRCENRHLGCHSTCSEYGEFQKECEKIRKLRFQEYEFKEYQSLHYNRVYHNHFIQNRGRNDRYYKGKVR